MVRAAPEQPYKEPQFASSGKISPDRSSLELTKYRWGVVLMLWLVCFFNYADRQAIFSVFPMLESEMGLSRTQLGLVGSAFMWVYAAFAPLAGLFGDRLRRKTLILTGLGFWSLITGLTGTAGSLWQLVLFRATEGFG